MAAGQQIRTHTALRGVAALLVVCYHLQFGAAYRLPFETVTPLFARGYLMVDLFFLLSGFIISYAYRADQVLDWPDGYVRRFLIGRVIRLYPLHLVCLAALVALNAVVAIGWNAPSTFAPASLRILFAQLLLVNAWLPGYTGWNIPSWSISAEAGAYLLFPVLALALARARAIAAMLMLALSIAFYAWIATGDGSLDLTAGLGPLRCLAGFLLGMLLFVTRERFAALSPWILSILQGLGATAMLAVLMVPHSDVAIIPAAALLVATTWTDRGVVARMLSPRMFHWLGEISYSVYLSHVPLVLAIGFVWERIARKLGVSMEVERMVFLAASLAIVVGVSTFTFRAVEAPARRWLGERLLHRRVKSIEASPAAP